MLKIKSRAQSLFCRRKSCSWNEETCGVFLRAKVETRSNHGEIVRYGFTCPFDNAGLSFRQSQDLFHTWHGGSHPGDDFDPGGRVEKGHHSHLLRHDHLWKCTLWKLPQGKNTHMDAEMFQRRPYLQCSHIESIQTMFLYVHVREICGHFICMCAEMFTQNICRLTFAHTCTHAFRSSIGFLWRCT